MTIKPWFKQSTSEIEQHLAIDTNAGLSHTEHQQRLNKYGDNALATHKSKSAWQLYFEQYKNPLIYILLVGALVSWFTGHLIDAIAIGTIIVINTGISFWQEYKAQKGMEALRDMAAPEADVLRDSKWIHVPARTLVPGDVIKISTGDILPADVRIVEANRLSIDEAALTGESEPVTKQVSAIHSKQVSLGDQINMGFMTTIVTTGSGLGIVTNTGMQTEVGRIAHMMTQTETTKTPMQVRMDTLAKALLFIGLGVVAVICAIGFAYGMDWLDILTTGISLSVAAIPEGLPTVLTIVLTMGSTKMAKNNALVKQLSAIETLGSTTVICSDKTGTLTQNQMQVMQAYDSLGRYWEVTGNGFQPKGKFVPQSHGVHALESSAMKMGLIVAAMSNESELAFVEDAWSVRGSPTEGALLVAAAKLGITPKNLEKQGYQILKRFPFDSERKMSSVIIQDPSGQHFLAVAGAPDFMLKKSSNYMVEGGLVPMEEQPNRFNELSQCIGKDLSKRFDGAIESFAKQALRTMAVGCRRLDETELDADVSELENDLSMLAVFGIMDPPRPEVRSAVKECYNAGIRTVMITGDHAATAAAIAKDIGIINGQYKRVVTGTELDNMSEQTLEYACEETAVFARVTPEHKLRIVQALQRNNEIAAMTGDGVNDAPALRSADIGVAMGITGTSVAKDSGDLILLDDNFSTIVRAVRQGRQIFDNLRKFIRQALTANVAEVSVILFAFLVMGPEAILPLTPLMILWVNLVSDGLPALALGVEPKEKDLMERKPRKRDQGFFSDGLGARIVIRGLALGGVSFGAFLMALSHGFSAQYAQSVAFLTLIFGQLWHLFDSRTFTSLYRVNPFTNKYLLGAIAASAILSLGVIYTNLGQLIFSTEAIELRHLAIILGVAALPTAILSAIKELTKTKVL